MPRRTIAAIDPAERPPPTNPRPHGGDHRIRCSARHEKKNSPFSPHFADGDEQFRTRYDLQPAGRTSGREALRIIHEIRRWRKENWSLLTVSGTTVNTAFDV